MPKISVIVPVYNTEKYLSKCLESLINQTYKDLEIIVINDGSTDNSDKIIKEYEKRYPNKIKSYEKENGGLSSARNYGLSKATGEYISFIDSDDYIDINLFEKLKSEIERGIDLIKFKLITVDKNYTEISKVDGPVFEEKNGEEAFNLLVFNDVLLEPACIYLYKRELFLKNKFKFSLNKYHEDFGLIPLIILKSKTVSSLNIYGYYYLQTNESITRNNNYNKILKSANDLLFHYDNMKKQIQNYEIEEKTKENILLYYTNAVFNIVDRLNKKDKKIYIQEICKRLMVNNIKMRSLKNIVKRIYFKLKFVQLRKEHN